MLINTGKGRKRNVGQVTDRSFVAPKGSRIKNMIAESNRHQWQGSDHDIRGANIIVIDSNILSIREYQQKMRFYAEEITA